MTDSTPDYGRSNLMVTSAVRYCLGRRTYIVGDCVDWLLRIWPTLDVATRRLIEMDIEAEFDADDRARANGAAYKPLGMDMDRQQWERVRKLWRVQS